jgi:uncharacterized protein (DUF1778 family)
VLGVWSPRYRCALNNPEEPVPGVIEKLREFVLESALVRADETLADRTRFGLDAYRWKAFMEALDAPPREIPRLGRLLKEPSVFERGD